MRTAWKNSTERNQRMNPAVKTNNLRVGRKTLNPTCVRVAVHITEVEDHLRKRPRDEVRHLQPGHSTRC